MGLLSFFARRFVAGETITDAIAAVQKVNARGMSAILDYLGEHVTSPEEAHAAAEEYLLLLQRIKESGVKAAVSLKASQMGIMVSPQVCLENLRRVAQRAESFGLMVWMDMEESALTQKTIDVFEELRNHQANVGLCLQAYLVRTGADLDRLMRRPLQVRLCKGAYKEAPSVAYTTKQAVDGSYRMLANKLLDNVHRGVYPAFATHDRTLIKDILTTVGQKRVDSKHFEFEMLYGIENNYLTSLSEKGFGAQVYIPYGQNWLPYFMRRLRERKENIYFLMRNLFRM